MSFIRAAFLSFSAAASVQAQQQWFSGYAESEAGMNGPVSKLVVLGDELVAVGSFWEAGGVLANFAAAYDGTTWRRLGSGGAFGGGGFSNSAFAAAVYRGELYAGGFFPWLGGAGGTTVNRIARFDGTQWRALGAGTCVGVDGGFGQVLAMTVHEDRLYVGGTFDTAGCLASANLASWDGTQWRAVATGNIDGFINALESHDGKLIIGGEFSQFAGLAVRGIVALDANGPSRIAGPGLGFLESIDSLASIDGQLYAGGNFRTINGVAAEDIARFDGAAWRPMGAGLSGVSVSSIVKHNGRIYISGLFSSSGNTMVTDIASFDGTAWQPLGAGVNGAGQTLAVYRGDLFVGGSFTLAGDVESARIARWGRTCLADFNGDDFIDFFDYADYVAAFETGAPEADVNGDDFIDFFDYADYVAAFETGC